jgi:aldehyde:ferredoxin oxidoreductase
MHFQGQEFPAHDPKAGKTFGGTYRLDATPARHTQGGDGGMGPTNPPGPTIDRNSWTGRGEARRLFSSWHHATTATGICDFGIGALPTMDAFMDMFRAVTGWDLTVDELVKTGERIGNLRHCFNIREGINLLSFPMPGRIIGLPPKPAGPTAGVTVDEATVERDYLTAVDWDLETTKPSKSKLRELGLENVLKQIYD